MEELIKREAEERERVLRQEFAKHKDVMAHTAWPVISFLLPVFICFVTVMKRCVVVGAGECVENRWL